MEKLEYERDTNDLNSKPKLKDAEFVLIKALENLTSAINLLRSKMK